MNRDEIIKKWEDSGVLNNINGEIVNDDITKLYCCKGPFIINEPPSDEDKPIVLPIVRKILEQIKNREIIGFL